MKNQTKTTVSDLKDLDGILSENELKEVVVTEEEEAEIMLADLELVEEIEELEVVEQTDAVVQDDGDLNEADIRELDAAISRKEVYESQEAAAVATTDKTATTGKKKAGGKRAAAGPRIERDLTAIGAEFFALIGDLTALPDAFALEINKVDVIAAKPSQVKVAEKFENFFQAVSVGKAPSRYTKIAFEALDKNKTVTNSDLVAAFAANGCGDGTARSQAGQMMVLFNALRIADRVTQTLTLRDDSIAAARLRAVLAA